ncbi:MAG: hypothetical protein C0175_00545 [Caldisericum exile]|uniref:Uncharacterized protein n=1 Tax=Caldisericum exile TaxID=693075 RepID=A0A2J6X9R0_9BACT|nr:MAG: hypothetical protein C0175_00545 [Caldisericum exile]
MTQEEKYLKNCKELREREEDLEARYYAFQSEHGETKANYLWDLLLDQDFDELEDILENHGF